MDVRRLRFRTRNVVAPCKAGVARQFLTRSFEWEFCLHSVFSIAGVHANSELKHPNDETSLGCEFEVRFQSPFDMGGDDISARKTPWDVGPIYAGWHAQVPSSASSLMGTIGGL